MAYTIISQNNSTTTLSDGVNTITVPSRVNLTSGNFTIVEVNNNMATLEDGDGNVYRDIPCVATLAGEGGGGGSGLPDQTGHSGEFLITDGTNTSWAAVDALPSQTGQSGKFLTTDGTDASWAAVNALQNVATQSTSLIVSDTPNTTNVRCTAFGREATATANWGMSFGTQAKVTAQHGKVFGNATAAGEYSIAVGEVSVTGARSVVISGRTAFSTSITAHDTIVLGSIRDTQGINSNRFYVGLDWTDASKTFEMLSPDGTIPTARLTKVNTTITLAAADWSSNTQTVSVTGMTATGVVLVSPDPTDQSAYTSAGIICSAQAAGTLTFTCDTVPSGDLSVNVVML